MESQSEAEGEWSAGSETGGEETPSKRVKANGNAYGNGNGNGLVGDEDGFGEVDVDAGCGMMAPDQFAAYQFDGVQEDQYV